MKLVSIALATYNGAMYLDEQLKSIFNQTYKNIELIIVDDYSTDNTLQIIQDYQKSHPCIYVARNEKNLGPTKTFERAVNLCTGEYIILCDQDDIWFNNKIEELVNNIGNHDLIHHDAIVVDANLNKINNSLLNYIKFFPITTFFERLVREGVHGCCLMMTKQVAQKATHIPNGFIYHDFYYNLVAGLNNNIITYKVPLMYYRLHDKNVCGINTNLSYQTFKKGYARNLNNMLLLRQQSMFKPYYPEIDNLIKYYTSILKLKAVSFNFMSWTAKNLGIMKAILLFLVRFSKEPGLKIAFYLRMLVNKIKQ